MSLVRFRMVINFIITIIKLINESNDVLHEINEVHIDLRFLGFVAGDNGRITLASTLFKIY